MPLPRRRTDVREHRVDDEAVLLDPRTGETYMLTRTALDVWSHCDGAHFAPDVAYRHVRLYDVDLASALDQVEQVVAFFAEANLLEFDESAG